MRLRMTLEKSRPSHAGECPAQLARSQRGLQRGRRAGLATSFARVSTSSLACTRANYGRDGIQSADDSGGSKSFKVEVDLGSCERRLLKVDAGIAVAVAGLLHVPHWSDLPCGGRTHHTCRCTSAWTSLFLRDGDNNSVQP